MRNAIPECSITMQIPNSSFIIDDYHLVRMAIVCYKWAGFQVGTKTNILGHHLFSAAKIDHQVNGRKNEKRRRFNACKA